MKAIVPNTTRRGLRDLADLIFTINKPLLGKKGIHYQKLLKDWSLIVGQDLASFTVPTKISTSRHNNNIEHILFVAVNSVASAALLVYRAGIIREQINFYFGYAYIQQLKFLQSSFQVVDHYTPFEQPLDQDQQVKLSASLTNYQENDEIRNILYELGKSIIQKNSNNSL